VARRLEDFVLHGRWYVMAAVAAVSVLAAVPYAGLTVENNIDAWFSARDPEYLRYREFSDRFETEDTVFVVVHAPDVFSTEVLERIDHISRACARLRPRS